MKIHKTLQKEWTQLPCTFYSVFLHDTLLGITVHSQNQEADIGTTLATKLQIWLDVTRFNVCFTKQDTALFCHTRTSLYSPTVPLAGRYLTTADLLFIVTRLSSQECHATKTIPSWAGFLHSAQGPLDTSRLCHVSTSPCFLLGSIHWKWAPVYPFTFGNTFGWFPTWGCEHLGTAFAWTRISVSRGRLSSSVAAGPAWTL